MAVSNQLFHTPKVWNDAYQDPQNMLYFLFVRKILKEVLNNKILQRETAIATRLTRPT